MLSNYSIKKMIPRLIVAAILVNVSFWIAALAVDVSNLLGYNLVQLFGGINVGDVETGGQTWNEVLSSILAFGVGIALIAAIVLAPTVLLALAMVVLILVARKALIVLLVVVAPIAFVLYLLPNTEDFFKKWYKMFFALLMVFPVIAVVFGASQLASEVLLEVAEKSSEGEETQNMLYVVALAVAAIPLFAVPTLLFGALKATGSLGAKLQGMSERRLSGASNAGKRRVGGFANNLKSDAGSRFRIASNNPESRLQKSRVGRQVAGLSRWNTRRGKLRDARSTAADRAEAVSYSEELTGKNIDGSMDPEKAAKLQRAAAGGRGVADQAAITRAAAQATKVGFKQFDEDVEAYKTTLTSMSNDALVKVLENNEGSKEYQAAVAGTIMERNHRDSHIAALRVMGNRAREADAAGDTAAKDVITDVQKQMAHDMRDKPWALGDQATGQLQNGTYGYTTSHTGQRQDQFGDIDQEMKTRVMTKLSTQSLVDMNPDELKAIHKMAKGTHPSGIKLNEAELTNLNEKIEAIKSSRYKDDVKPEAQALLEEIKVEYRNTTTGSAAPAAGPTSGPAPGPTPGGPTPGSTSGPRPKPSPPPSSAPSSAPPPTPAPPSSPWPQASPTSAPPPSSPPPSSPPPSSAGGGSTTLQGKTYGQTDGGLYIPRDNN
jgi:hypothetical protein